MATSGQQPVVVTTSDGHKEHLSDQPIDRVRTSGMQFDPEKVRKHFKEHFANEEPCLTVTAEAAVYTAAMMEYVCAEAAELCGVVTALKKRSDITPHDIATAFRSDDDGLHILALEHTSVPGVQDSDPFPTNVPASTIYSPPADSIASECTDTESEADYQTADATLEPDEPEEAQAGGSKRSGNALADETKRCKVSKDRRYGDVRKDIERSKSQIADLHQKVAAHLEELDQEQGRLAAFEAEAGHLKARHIEELKALIAEKTAELRELE